MADVWFDNPPQLQGMETEQLQQLYSYLGIMSDKLNQALMNITIEQMAPETKQTIRYAAEVQPAEAERTTKELIIKTAQIVRTEMDEIRTTLERNIKAISDDYGELYETLQTQINTNAEGIQLRISEIKEVRDGLGEVQTKQNDLDNYIQVGVIGEEGGQNIYGVAIGQGSNLFATFSGNQLAFYQGGNTPVAYFSDNRFHITNGEITDSLTIGNHYWKKLNDGGLALIAGNRQSGGGN